MEENEPEKLKNRLRYNQSKKIKNKNGCNHAQSVTATLFRHLMNKDTIF